MQFIKEFCPPIGIRFLKKLVKNKHGWSGNYKSWKEAISKCTGYDSAQILSSVREALLKVKEGNALYERDSVVFNEVQYAWPLLASLMWIAAQNKGEITLIDFGGSLGSTYFQNKTFLSSLTMVRWNIVEQKHFVETGKTLFENESLRFYYDIESCMKEKNPNTILLSSVIQYIEQPYLLLKQIIDRGFQYILIDRTSFCLSGNDRIAIQKVPPSIYKASYPCWFLNRDHFYSFFKNKYNIIATFKSNDAPQSANEVFEGCLLQKQ